MTLREKIGQLNQAGTRMNCALPGFEADIDTWVSEMLQGKLAKEELDRRLAMCEENLREDEVASGELGNFVNLYEDEKIARVQKAAVEDSRLKIPLLIAAATARSFRRPWRSPAAGIWNACARWRMWRSGKRMREA